ncbi:TetR family transcriptional regulator [Nocardioides sp. C4-1]|uniref:TetR/AcrR family transcriptional regulator n=1 Tax=Nocardioides sp. C4-1 TaxID=3151851 RepID=UPI003265432E
MVVDTREAIRDAAFRLFADQGYAVTTVDEIVRAAGVARSTFFRLFGSKEGVIFPEHDVLLQRLEERLFASTAESALHAVSDAVRIVLFHYVAEGERARERYRLTSAVPALRDRELVGSAQYQRLFRRFIADMGDGTDGAQMRAELMAAAVVAAHNRVLRRWLRGECPDPQVEIDAAMDAVLDLWRLDRPSPAVVVALPAEVSISEAISALQGLR